MIKNMFISRHQKRFIATSHELWLYQQIIASASMLGTVILYLTQTLTGGANTMKQHA